MMIPEQTSQTFTAIFTDKNNVLVQPEFAWYSCHDVDSGTVIIPVTMIPNPQQVEEIEVTTDMNKILDDTKMKETRNLTVQFKYRNAKGELVDGATEEILYTIRNLRFIK